MDQQPFGARRVFLTSAPETGMSDDDDDAIWRRDLTVAVGDSDTDAPSRGAAHRGRPRSPQVAMNSRAAQSSLCAAESDTVDHVGAQSSSSGARGSGQKASRSKWILSASSGEADDKKSHPASPKRVRGEPLAEPMPSPRSPSPGSARSARSDPSPPPGYRQRLLKPTPVEKPAQMEGTAWWHDSLRTSVEHLRTALPENPSKPMTMHSMCSGLGAELLACKVVSVANRGVS